MRLTLAKMTSLRGLHDLQRMLAALQFALPATGLPADAPGRIDLILVTRPRMTLLNGLHLHHPGATDVITYDLRGGFTLWDSSEEPLWAEIYICPAVAFEQAPLYGETPSRELFRYAIHGLLHLAGEDDLTPASLKAMRQAEARALSAAEARFSLEGFLSSPLPPSR
ncbi:MAG: rRNA maturation RNase YbeY [Victivallales bacterium]|nr:rRNA maturation RNase YbeY [Victivallales bacterium]